MHTRISNNSPQIYARGAAVLYIITIVAGIMAQMVIGGQVIVSGDAAATATNILANKELFQVGFSLYMLEMLCQSAQMLLFYILLNPVNRNIALMGLGIGLIGSTIKTISRLFYLAPLLVLSNPEALQSFNTAQLQDLALLLLNINDQAAGIALIFFGVSTFVNGYLIFRSGYLPRILGVFSMLGGLGWFTYIYPPFGNQMLMLILPIALMGSFSIIGWLLVKGVNIERWQQRALVSA